MLGYVGGRGDPFPARGGWNVGALLPGGNTVELWIFPTLGRRPQEPVDLSDFDPDLVDKFVEYSNSGRDLDSLRELSLLDRVKCLAMAERSTCHYAIVVLTSLVFEMFKDDPVNARRTAASMNAGSLLTVVDASICSSFSTLKLTDYDLKNEELATRLDTDGHNVSYDRSAPDSVYFASEELIWRLVRWWILTNKKARSRQKNELVSYVRPRLLADPLKTLGFHKSIVVLPSLQRLLKDAVRYAERFFLHHVMHDDASKGVRHRYSQIALIGCDSPPTKPMSKFVPVPDVDGLLEGRRIVRCTVRKNLAYVAFPDEENGGVQVWRYNPTTGALFRLPNGKIDRNHASICITALD